VGKREIRRSRGKDMKDVERKDRCNGKAEAENREKRGRKVGGATRKNSMFLRKGLNQEGSKQGGDWA